MYLLTAIIVGLIIGVVAGYLIQENFDLMILNIAMGIVGAVSGAAVYYFVGSDDISLITAAGIGCQAAGALLFLLIFSALHKMASRKEDIDISQ